MDVQKPPKVKFVLGIIYSGTCDIRSLSGHLESVFGTHDTISAQYAFDITDYYEPEMGKDLWRIFISFEKLINPAKLPEIKLLTNLIEKKYCLGQKRYVNLDPGYLDLDKFVLASAKYGRQKIYMDKGIFADPTMYFYKKEFHAYDWSFPDFAKGYYNEYFLGLRQIYKNQLKTC